MSIFSEGAGPSQSSEAELATLMKDEPADPAPASEATPEPPAQAPESAATDAPAADAPQQPAAAEPAPAATKTVPLASLMEERTARQTLERQLAQLQGQFEAMQRMQPQAQQPQPGPQQPEPPDPETDPIGALQYERQQRMQLQQHLQVQAVERQITDAYTADVQQQASKIPDFGAAYSHLLTALVGQLQALGWTAAQIKQQVRNEEMGIAVNALRQNKSPAQAVYDMAKIYGYAGKPAAPPAPAAPDPALQEARQKAAVSLSEGGKPEKGGELSLDDIVNLKGAAQESALKAWEKRNGGRSSIFRE